MKKKFKITIMSNNFSILISRIIIILNRRNIDIFYLNLSYLKNSKVMCCICKIQNFEDYIEKIIKQINKQIGIISVSYQEIDNKKNCFIYSIKQNSFFKRIFKKLNINKK